MAIPKEKLERWTAQGAVDTSKSTHESIRKAIKDSEELDGIEFDVYLQGSYKNSTNIYGESDVDVVVQLNTSWYKDISNLPTVEQNLYNSSYVNATYHLPEFRSSVLKALIEYFGYSNVSEGNKCIKVKKSSNRLDGDIVVCMQYRDYKEFIGVNNQNFDEGIKFTTKNGDIIISYPNIHYDNGLIKNSNTNGLFKPTVRLFKNARSYLINQNIIDANLAPSFFVECMLYNAPNDLFVSNNYDTFLNILKWLVESFKNDNYTKFMRQDEKSLLFGNSNEQWDFDKSVDFVIKLIELLE